LRRQQFGELIAKLLGFAPGELAAHMPRNGRAIGRPHPFLIVPGFSRTCERGCAAE
jgi:hypothetical protein